MKKDHSNQNQTTPLFELEIGVYAVKGVLISDNRVKNIYRPTAGNPALAAEDCLQNLFKEVDAPSG